MIRPLFASLSVLALTTAPVLAQDTAFGTEARAIEIATEAGVCGEAPVASATFTSATNVSATCDEDVEGFVPLVGGLVPVLVGGVAVVLAAATGGGAPPDTQ